MNMNTVANAININDRGEILAKAAPLGFTPNDDADLGHLVLLVPCDDEREDCSAPLQNAEMAPGRKVTPSTPLSRRNVRFDFR